MNCEQFENLLPDALGDELSTEDRAAFALHLQACARCKRDYESSLRTVASLRALPIPPRVLELTPESPSNAASLGPQNESAVRPDKDSRFAPALATAQSDSRRFAAERTRARRWLPAFARYAAVIVFAFMAGYVVHDVRSPATDAGPSVIPAGRSTSPGARSDRTGLSQALVMAYQQNPGGSDLAKCLRAMYTARASPVISGTRD